jgi:hypothetical protein
MPLFTYRTLEPTRNVLVESTPDWESLTGKIGPQQQSKSDAARKGNYEKGSNYSL